MPKLTRADNSMRILDSGAHILLRRSKTEPWVYEACVASVTDDYTESATLSIGDGLAVSHGSTPTEALDLLSNLVLDIGSRRTSKG